MSAQPAAPPGGFHGIPGALRMADAFHRFGDHRLDTIRALRTLPATGQWLSVDPRIAWYPIIDPTVARHLTARAQADGVAVSRMGLGCSIVLQRMSGAADGLAQAACMLMPTPERLDHWARLAALGDEILIAARTAVKAGTRPESFSDLIALKRLSDSPSDEAVRDALQIATTPATEGLDPVCSRADGVTIPAAVMASYHARADAEASLVALILSRTLTADELYRSALGLPNLTETVETTPQPPP